MFFEQLIESIEEHRAKNHPANVDRYHENPVIEAVAPSETDGGAKSASDQTETVKLGLCSPLGCLAQIRVQRFCPGKSVWPPGKRWSPID